MFGRKKHRRPANVGEVCTCGRPATIVYASPAFGEVGSCLSWEPLKPVKPCPFCGNAGKHTGQGVCPMYRVSPEWAQAGYTAEEVAGWVRHGSGQLTKAA